MNESQTPRTDEEAQRITIDCDDSCVGIYVRRDGEVVDDDVILAPFARQLETELNAAKAELAEAVKRMEAVPVKTLIEVFEPCEWLGGWDAGVQAVRAHLISAAKGEP